MPNPNLPINGQYNTYVGARYVPKFANPVEWDNTKQYEPLTIVTYQGNSYTSTTFVPIGTQITNTTYWAPTGNYNAQVESYRQEVLNLQNSNNNKPYYFTSLMDATNYPLKSGDIIQTGGYYQIEDGGQGIYIITNTQPNNDYYVQVGSLFGVPVFNEGINPGAYGAVSGYDAGAIFNKCIQQSHEIRIPLNCSPVHYQIETPILVNVSCDINFNSCFISPNQPMAACLIIDCPTDATRSSDLKGPVQFNGNNYATAGIQVIRNINAIRCYDITINDPLTYGVYCSGGPFVCDNLKLRNNNHDHLHLIGIQNNVADTAIRNCVMVNYEKAVVTTGYIELLNFHPFVTWPEIMETSVGITSSATCMLTHSYIDTYATVFAGNGYFIYADVYLFWNSEYFNSTTVASQNIPLLIDDASHLIGTGLRNAILQSPFKLHINKVQTYLSDLRVNNTLQSLYTEPYLAFNTANPTLDANFSGFTVNNFNIYRQAVNIYFYMVLTANEVTPVTLTPICQIPSGYRPKCDVALSAVAVNGNIAEPVQVWTQNNAIRCGGFTPAIGTRFIVTGFWRTEF